MPLVRPTVTHWCNSKVRLLRAGTCYNDTGLFGVYMVTPMNDKDMVMEVFHHVQEQMVAITTGITDEDLVRVG